MKKLAIASVLLGSLLLAGGRAQAADTLVDNLKKACDKELKTFCKGVKPGEGRILACLYAFEDQVSGKCIYALYDAAAQFEQAAVALKFAASECKDDLQKFCANVPVGKGRVLACLDKHDKDVSQRCKDALKQTGIK
jgi:hypothetical protein